MLVSVAVRGPDGERSLVTKGAPEAVLPRCLDVPADAAAALQAEFAAGNRVVAVATRPLPSDRAPEFADEKGLNLMGFLVFLDPPKRGASQALARLAGLGITVKVVTGDNGTVAAKVCNDLGLDGSSALNGSTAQRPGRCRAR